MNCKNCKYYEPIESKSNGVLPYGECNSPNINNNEENTVSEERTKAENWSLTLGANNVDLQVESCCGRDWVQVGENFGCIHFEKKI